MAYTTIGVSEKTKNMLDILKREKKIKSYDMLINKMVAKEKALLLDNIFGIVPEAEEFRRNKNEFERKL